MLREHGVYFRVFFVSLGRKLFRSLKDSHKHLEEKNERTGLTEFGDDFFVLLLCPLFSRGSKIKEERNSLTQKNLRREDLFLEEWGTISYDSYVLENSRTGL